MPQRTLIAYYSMTGKTRKIADEIRSTIGADFEEIREPKTRHGVGGMLRAFYDAIVRREPPIEPITRNPVDYDLLVLGGPVWAGRMAAPVRTYAHRYGAQAHQVAFFCTEGGRGAQQAFAELEKFCQHAPSATLVVDAGHLEPLAHQDALRHFARSVRPTVQ